MKKMLKNEKKELTEYTYALPIETSAIHTIEDINKHFNAIDNAVEKLKKEYCAKYIHFAIPNRDDYEIAMSEANIEELKKEYEKTGLLTTAPLVCNTCIFYTGNYNSISCTYFLPIKGDENA